MISPIPREQILDLTNEPLDPGWLRRAPTRTESHELVGPGVWRTGPQLLFRNELVSAMNKAREVILLSSFLLADDHLAQAMIQAAERGVRVYVLTASEQRIGKVLREDDIFEQRMVEKHKKLLEGLADKVLLRSAEHIHAKFLIVDPQSESGACAWLSTANFNKALEDSVELGVMLDADRVRGLAACFNWAFWCEAERELRGPNRLVEIKPNHPAAPPRPSHAAIFATLRDSMVLREQLIALIRGARNEILVASYGIAADHAAVGELVEAARRGVLVTVLTRPRPAVAAGVALLASVGVSIFAHDKLHAKAVVADGKALIMSANLEAQGLDKGFEIGAVLPADTARAVETALREWASSFPWIYRADAMRGQHRGDFCPALFGLRDGVVKVVHSHSQTVADVFANDALHLSDTPPPALKPSLVPGELPQQVMFTWSVLPPRLPKGAKEQFKTNEREKQGKNGKSKKEKESIPYVPPVYELMNKRYVLLRNAEEADKAQQLAADLGAMVVLP